MVAVGKELLDAHGHGTPDHIAALARELYRAAPNRFTAELVIPNPVG